MLLIPHMYLLLSSPSTFHLPNLHPSPLSICFSHSLGFRYFLLQLPIFAITQRAPLSNQAGRYVLRPVTEFGGNTFALPWSHRRTYLCRQRTLFNEVFGYSYWLGDSTEAISKSGATLEFTIIKTILPKTLTAGFKDLHESDHSCLSLEAAPKEGEITFHLRTGKQDL